MQKRIWLIIILSMVLIGAVAAAGCGKDKDPEPLDVTGNWAISMNGTIIDVITAQNFVHTQTTITVTGPITDTAGNYANAITGSTTVPAGQKNLRDITLIITFTDGIVATLTGRVQDNNNKMYGDYTTPDTGNGAGSGTWSAERK